MVRTMYEPGTVLRLREPQSTDEKPYPYDRVEVLGQSPIQHATASGSPWAGVDAVGFILRPAGDGFDANVDKPLGEINALYEIESFPVVDQTGQPLSPQAAAQTRMSPEQLFAQAAANVEPPAPRVPVPSVQDDRKSPEQVLREATVATKPAARGRKPKEQ